MDYERIDKPFSSQSGGFSPGKLRVMLLGVEKKRKEEEEHESKSSLRSEQLPEIEDGRTSAADSCKDVECSTSTEMSSGHRSRDFGSFDSESVSSGFEFQNAERAPPAQRVMPAAAFLPPFSKPAPSKWDDAQKWIASPTSNRGGSKAGGGQGKKGGAGYGVRQGLTKVVVEVLEEPDTKRVDGNQTKKEVGGIKSMNWVHGSNPVADSGVKPAFVLETPVADPAVCLSQHDPSTSLQITTAFVTPAPTVRAVSMRDVGTEMTPIASQEPSRTGTPARATSPLRSPTTSEPSTLKRTAPDLTPTVSDGCHKNCKNTELSKKELQKKTRREIMVLGQQLGKTNIASWASKEEEETNASKSLKTDTQDQTAKSVIEARAVAWEEAEKAKYLARFKQQEIKIQAWENHQKAKTEAEMRKVEVMIEKMRAYAHERLMNQLAAARHQAEEMRVAAEAKRNQQAAKTAQQAEYIRRTGRIPSSFSCWGWCS